MQVLGFHGNDSFWYPCHYRGLKITEQKKKFASVIFTLRDQFSKIHHFSTQILVMNWPIYIYETKKLISILLLLIVCHLELFPKCIERFMASRT